MSRSLVGRSLVVRPSVVNIHTSYTDLIYSSFATLGTQRKRSNNETLVTDVTVNYSDQRTSSRCAVSVQVHVGYLNIISQYPKQKACPHQAIKLPKTATNCCRKRQQSVARNGDFDRCCDNVAVSGNNNLLPFRQLCCLVWTGLQSTTKAKAIFLITLFYSIFMYASDIHH